MMTQAMSMPAAFVAMMRRVKFVPLLMALCLSFTACADLSTMSPAEQSVERSKRRFIATTAEGAVGGALLGAVVGGLAGGRRGALIGAAAGGVLGGSAGAFVAQNNFRRSQTEANYNAAIQEASEQASQARQDAANGQQIAANARANVAQMRAQLRNGQLTAAQYKSNIAGYQRSLASLREISKGCGEQIAGLRQDAALAGNRGSTFNTSANDISASKASLDRAINDLYAVTASEPS